MMSSRIMRTRVLEHNQEANIFDRKIKVLSVFGTRPEAVKMAPLVKELNSCSVIDSYVCVTGQHKEMLHQVLELFEIIPDFDLDIMRERQTLEGITVRIIEGMGKVLDDLLPDLVLVHGDTTTTFAASLAAFYKKISVGHVEAGLRTFDKYFPYPEEINRKLTGVLADLHFAPTAQNAENLRLERVDPDRIFITGNTVIDALKTTVSKEYVFENEMLKKIDFENKRVICVTAHRRENLGEPLIEICEALKELAYKYDDVQIVYPVHLNPAVKDTVNAILGDVASVHLISPLGVQDMHNLMDRSYLILTDSGGLQEEAPALGKPVLVLRNETERPEAIKSGTAMLAGTNKEKILELSCNLLDSSIEYDKMAKAVNPYGDGAASARIVKSICYHYGLSHTRPEDFTFL